LLIGHVLLRGVNSKLLIVVQVRLNIRDTMFAVKTDAQNELERFAVKTDAQNELEREEFVLSMVPK